MKYALPAIMALTSVLWTGHAQGYVCTRVPNDLGVESGPSLSWSNRSVQFTLESTGTAQISGTEEFDDFRNAFQAWEDISPAWTGRCSDDNENTDLEFIETAMSTGTNQIGYDYLQPTNNKNLLLFHETTWPHTGQTGIVIALTTTTYNSTTGEIIDADIEFNSADFNFTAASSAGPVTDLLNSAVHEIGHLLGLAHSSDNTATMYGVAITGETKKRDLACDDAQAIGLKYPAGSPNGYCDPPDSSCGFCGPPDTLDRTVTIEVVNSSNTLGGCANQPSSIWAVLLFGIVGVTRLKFQRVKKSCIRQPRT